MKERGYLIVSLRVCMYVYLERAQQRTHNGILVPVRTSFGLRRRSGKTYNVST